MTTRFHRRQFLGRTAALAATAAGTRLFAAPNILSSPSPNSKLNIAGIGVGGRGSAHVDAFMNENLVAVCDVDPRAIDGCLRHLERHYKDHGRSQSLPQTFSDYRKMLDKMHGQIDAVFVAMPDNHHAIASMMAMKLGKHVYCEKPLTHDIYEARQLTLAARQHKVATQMGNQRPPGRRLAAVVRMDLGRRDRQRPRGALLDRSGGHRQAILVGRRAEPGRQGPIRCRRD